MEKVKKLRLIETYCLNTEHKSRLKGIAEIRPKIYSKVDVH
jgi:hypothetical protein